MLLDFDELLIKHDMKIKGVIQIGSHEAQEHEIYCRNRIDRFIYVEPCKNAFNKLIEKFSNEVNVSLINCACAEFDGKAEMYIESANNGQSNSLQKPVNHIKQYPSIVFNEKEEVEVKKLDSFKFNRAEYNFLNLDCQCAEMRVLKGATETLLYIDYIMSEVNKPGAELYEGCTDIDEMDDFLSEFNFTRVESPRWIGGTWADSLWIRNTLL